MTVVVPEKIATMIDEMHNIYGTPKSRIIANILNTFTEHYKEGQQMLHTKPASTPKILEQKEVTQVENQQETVLKIDF